MFERYTDRARRVVELSLREALQLGHSYIAPEHILLALIREGESVAAQVLIQDCDLSLGEVRKAVISRLSTPVHEHAFVVSYVTPADGRKPWEGDRVVTEFCPCGASQCSTVSEFRLPIEVPDA